MRIHSRKVKEDFNLYFDDLEASIRNSLKLNREKDEFFKNVYPLFVLLETLFSPSYFFDPTKQIELNECIESGNKDEIMSARRALFRTKISKALRKGLRKQYFTPYLNELYSDAFLLLNQYYLNNYRGCYLYLRRILEDLYKQIYYLDHKQEFYMVSSGASEFELGITPQFLRGYLEKVSHLCYLQDYNTDFERLEENNKLQKKQTIFDLNNQLYSKTSAFVHPSRTTFMSNFTSNSDLIFEEDKSETIIKFTKRVVSISIIFLISIHFQQFLQFNEFEKNLVFSAFKGQRKGNFRKVLGI
jgi:hypothetical protein